MNLAPTLATLSADVPSRTGGASGIHLEFLDGIRGLSAFYVLLHHAYLMLLDAGVGAGGGLAGLLMSGLRPLAFGRYAVDMFIVLSGYCLMLPMVRGANGMKGGFKGYIRRRARRILPPYYAALTISLLVILLVHPWKTSVQDYSEIVWDLPGTGDLLAHVFLVHNVVNAGPTASTRRCGASPRNGKSISCFPSCFCPYGNDSASSRRWPRRFCSALPPTG